MTTEIYVVSGFLGAGKTTLIKKLLKEEFQKEKVILIENDFGEISVDAALLRSGNIEVKEMNSGCICCSLSGDFIKALKEVLDRFHPDKVIIEPSGVGKLSDIKKCCLDPRIRSLAKVKLTITVVDVKRCKMYLDNFGEFFEDQIHNADTILLSRTENFPDRVDAARKLVRGLNTRSVILTKPWDEINASEILLNKYNNGTNEQCGVCGHDHHGDCDHNHPAEDAFDTVTIRTKQIYDTGELKALVSAMERNTKGTVLRAKGIVRSTNGYINLQYLPGDIQVSECSAAGGMLCIIGRNLNRRELCTLFRGE